MEEKGEKKERRKERGKERKKPFLEIPFFFFYAEQLLCGDFNAFRKKTQLVKIAHFFICSVGLCLGSVTTDFFLILLPWLLLLACLLACFSSVYLNPSLCHCQAMKLSPPPPLPPPPPPTFVVSESAWKEEEKERDRNTSAAQFFPPPPPPPPPLLLTSSRRTNGHFSHPPLPHVTSNTLTCFLMRRKRETAGALFAVLERSLFLSLLLFLCLLLHLEAYTCAGKDTKIVLVLDNFCKFVFTCFWFLFFFPPCLFLQIGKVVTKREEERRVEAIVPKWQPSSPPPRSGIDWQQEAEAEEEEEEGKKEEEEEEKAI